MRALILLCLLVFPLSAHGQDEAPAGPPLPELTAPYDPYLLRLAEVLGSVHYLRTLCQTGEGTTWRDAMTDLIALENPLPARRARLVARFNRGYRALDEVYRACTPSARLAGDRYTEEGRVLTRQITQRFGR